MYSNDMLGLTAEPFETVKANGYHIRGREIYSPLQDKQIPVIIAHGFTADMTRPERFAVPLARLGYHCFVFDFCGGGFHTISDGSFHDYMTCMTEVEDLQTVIDWLRIEKSTEVDIGHLYVAGGSQGGFVASMTAADPAYRDKIFGLILFYPALCIPDDARKGSMQVIRFDPKNIPDHIGEGPMRLCGDYARTVIDYDPYEYIGDYPGPVLLLHGDKDTVVPVSYSDRAKKVYGDHCLYYVLDGADHGFTKETDLKKAIEYTDSFIKKENRL